MNTISLFRGCCFKAELGDVVYFVDGGYGADGIDYIIHLDSIWRQGFPEGQRKTQERSEIEKIVREIDCWSRANNRVVVTWDKAKDGNQLRDLQGNVIKNIQWHTNAE